MVQFKAGYIADSIAEVVNVHRDNLDNHKPEDKIKLDQINGLLQYVSSFDVKFPEKHEPDYQNLG